MVGITHTTYGRDIGVQLRIVVCSYVVSYDRSVISSN